jgi:membrane protein YdbS with pleckstrin-like domain
MSHLNAFIANPINCSYDGKDSDEDILYVVRQSHWTNIKWALGIIVLFILPFVVAPFVLPMFGRLLSHFNPFFIIMVWVSWYLMVLGLWFFNFLNWYFNVYIITSKKIIDFDFYGLTYKNISEMPIANVEDVTSKVSGPISTMFNIGHVYIQTAAEKTEFEFTSVDDPGKLRDIISDLAAKSQNR